MNALIDFFLNIFNGIVDILNIRLFDDMPITYLQLILGCMIIPYILNFIFVGFKEIDKNTNINYIGWGASVINNRNRKNQINSTMTITNSKLLYRNGDSWGTETITTTGRLNIKK